MKTHTFINKIALISIFLFLSCIFFVRQVSAAMISPYDLSFMGSVYDARSEQVLENFNIKVTVFKQSGFTDEDCYHFTGNCYYNDNECSCVPGDHEAYLTYHNYNENGPDYAGRYYIGLWMEYFNWAGDNSLENANLSITVSADGYTDSAPVFINFNNTRLCGGGFNDYCWKKATNNIYLVPENDNYTYTKIKGQITDIQTNQPIPNALVKLIITDNNSVGENDYCDILHSVYTTDELYCVPNEPMYYQTHTDQNGRYDFTQILSKNGSDFGRDDYFAINVSADNYTSTTLPYLYTSAVSCSQNENCNKKVVNNFQMVKENDNQRVPVIIVPGILGSYLWNMSGDLVWIDLFNTIFDPWDFSLNQLSLSYNGEPQGDGIMVSHDVLRYRGESDYYQGLINEFVNIGYEENTDLFVFPYDWRLDISKSTDDLKNKIEEIKQQTGSNKVNIVAHSMGGLLTKKYIKNYGQNSVDKFIDIATPHLGSPQAFKTLTFGDDFGASFIINQERIKSISQNMPSVYQLLPSRKYFDISDSDYGNYIADVYDIDKNNIKGNLNFDQSMQLMTNMGRNSYLLAKNDQLHNDIDNFDPLAYGVKAYNIVGCGQPTVGKTYILNKEKNGYEYGLKYISGDSTVPLKSAENLKNTINTYYYTSGVEHSRMSSAPGVKELAAAIINNQNDNFNFSQYPNIKQNSNDCALNGWEVSFHSPIDLNIYDENNNHLGPNQNGDIEMGIADASYDIIDNNKFAFLPVGHTYRITGQATDIGSFNARVQNIENSEIVKTQYFNNIPLSSTGSNVEYNLNDQTGGVAMQIDQDGDHNFENSIQPSSILNQTESQDTEKPQTTSTIIGVLGQNGWYQSDVNLTLNSQDNDNGSGILKTEYSTDNGQIWQIYTEAIVLNQNGRYNIKYKATDKAGNVEEEKEIGINIDKDGPVIDVFSPINNDQYLRSENLNLTYDISDVQSGAATNTIKITIDNTELNTSIINLFDYKLGSHTINISARDLAGNTTSTKINFIITANIDSVIADVGIAHNRGWINDKAEKQLTNQLTSIKKQIEKFGQRKVVIDAKFAEAMKKCVAKKGDKWCKNNLQPRLNTTTYLLNKFYQKIIGIQYQFVLVELKQLQQKKWINLQAYNLLKEDLDYLINGVK